MASNSRKDSEAAHEHFWVGKETLEAILLFSTDGAARIPRCLIGRREDWEITLPITSRLTSFGFFNVSLTAGTKSNVFTKCRD